MHSIALQGEVASECGEEGAQYDQVMEKLRQDIEANSKCVFSIFHFLVCVTCHLPTPHSDMSAVKGSLPFFRKSLEKMHSTRKCPLCTRGFSDPASFDKTVKSVRLSTASFSNPLIHTPTPPPSLFL